jgi:hypothetical protein
LPFTLPKLAGRKNPVLLFGDCYVFFGNKFSTLAEPGFFVPALQVGFCPAGKGGTKKGGVNDLQNSWSATKQSDFAFYNRARTRPKAFMYL